MPPHFKLLASRIFLGGGIFQCKYRCRILVFSLCILLCFVLLCCFLWYRHSSANKDLYTGRTGRPKLTGVGTHFYVVIHTIDTDPTIRQPGFDLPLRTWFLMNRFRTGQGPCRANLHKWGLAQSPSCDCGQPQTMNHIVDTCPLTKIDGRPNLPHEADDNAVIWLESTATAALAK